MVIQQPRSVAWILKFTSNLPADEQVKCLQANDTPTMRTILRGAFDPEIKWMLPEGPAPYTPYEHRGLEHALHTEANRLYLFVEGYTKAGLTPQRRERLFIELLESIDADDAELLIAIKDKKLPWDSITPKTVLKAFPGLF